MTVGWGIIGIGHHADRRIAPAIAAVPNGRLVAAYSRDPDRATSFAAKHGAARSYPSLEALLGDGEVDAVFIASPNYLHASQTIQAAAAGKHILVEKPMALSPADGQAMIDACQRAGVKLGVGFHMRYHPAHQEARRLIAAGEVGEVVVVQAQFAGGVASATRGRRATPRSPQRSWWAIPDEVGGGIMMGMGVHVVDLLHYLSGDEVTEVHAFTDAQPPEHPLETTAVALLRFRGGAFAFLSASGSIPHPENNLIIRGSLATVIGVGTVGVEPVGELRFQGNATSTRWQFRAQDLYAAQVEAFGQAIEYETDFAADGWDGLRACQVTEAIFRSAQEGRAVTVDL